MSEEYQTHPDQHTGMVTFTDDAGMQRVCPSERARAAANSYARAMGHDEPYPGHPSAIEDISGIRWPEDTR